jgi:hypothetical protein
MFRQNATASTREHVNSPWVLPGVRPRVLASLRARATPKRVLTAPCGLRCARGDTTTVLRREASLGLAYGSRTRDVAAQSPIASTQIALVRPALALPARYLLRSKMAASSASTGEEV